MTRDELELAIRSATEIIHQHEVLIIGSQSILGSYDESDLPERATMSNEVDIAPLSDDDAETLATLLDAAVGEWSPFQDEHGFYIQGVGMRTAILPQGWAERLVPVHPKGHPDSVGLCLDPHDLCAAKLARNDDKDREYVLALIDADIIQPQLLRNRIDEIPDDRLDPKRKRVIRMFVKRAQERQQE